MQALRVLCVLAVASTVLAVNINHLKHAAKAKGALAADSEAEAEADIETEGEKSGVQKRSCHSHHDDCAACVAAQGTHMLLMSHACVFDSHEKQCRRAIPSRRRVDGWVSKNAHCAAANLIPKQRNLKRIARYCHHFPGHVCRETTAGLLDFDKATATVAELSAGIVVTDVAFAGPTGPMTLHNKETPSDVDPTKTLYDIGVEYGKRACGSGLNAAQGMSLALMKGTPNERRVDMEGIADGVLNTITADACKAAVCDTLALAVLSKLKAKGATVRREWITYKYQSNSGHSVVVLNRAVGSQLDDWKTWGPDAYTIDLWYKGLKSDPTLDAAGHVGSGIRWGAEQSAHARSESASALRGSGIGVNYDSLWTSTVNDGRAHELNHVDVVAEPTKYALYTKTGTPRALIGETTTHEARDLGFEKVTENGKTFYVDPNTTPDMVE